MEFEIAINIYYTGEVKIMRVSASEICKLIQIQRIEFGEFED